MNEGKVGGSKLRRRRRMNNRRNEMADSEKQVREAPSNFKSKVWAHFGFYNTDDGKTLDKDYAICKNCLAKVKYNGNTTNMHSHLVRHHPDLASEEKTANVSTPGSQPTLDTVFKAKLPFASPRAASITKSIAGFICKDLRPYSVVENEGFRRMLTTLEPRYEVPSRRYFTDKAIPALYAETRAKVEDALQSAERVALTCDGWTSRATESTAHFIDNNWELQSYVLQTRVMHESHTGAHMAEVLEKATEEWKLTGKEPAVVTDNASNMSVAVEMTGYQHIRCFAHVLNLASQRALKLTAVARLLGRVRRISVFFHRSTPAADALKRNQRMLGLAPHKLITDVVVRWNSAYEMLTRFLEQQPAVTAALLSPEVRCLSYIVTELYEKSVTICM